MTVKLRRRALADTANACALLAPSAGLALSSGAHAVDEAGGVLRPYPRRRHPSLAHVERYRAAYPDDQTAGTSLSFVVAFRPSDISANKKGRRSPGGPPVFDPI